MMASSSDQSADALGIPAVQEEARVRALRRAQLLAALKEKTAGIPRASAL